MNSSITDTHLQYLQPLKNVTVLRLRETRITDAGLVHVLNGVRRFDPTRCCPIFFSAGGLNTTGSRIWHQDIAGIAGSGENGDHFGLTVY